MLRASGNKTTLYELVLGKVAHRFPIIENTRLLPGLCGGITSSLAQHERSKSKTVHVQYQCYFDIKGGY